MKEPKRKKHSETPEGVEEIDDGRPVKLEALEELTSSEVIEQVKAGLSRIAPLETPGDDEEFREEEAA